MTEPPISDAAPSAFKDFAAGGATASAASVLTTIAGGALATWGLRRGGAAGFAAGFAGGLLAAGGLATAPAVRRRVGSNPFERAAAQSFGWSSASIVTQGVGVNAPREQLYEYWRDFTNLPRFMVNIERIDVIDDTRSHWVVTAPFGKTVEWDAIVTEDVPNQRIAWRSAEGADIRNNGWVEFKDGPAGRGSEVRATIVYEPPMGELGRLAAKLTQMEPNIQARRDLKRFKSLIETGEIATNAPQGTTPKS